MKMAFFVYRPRQWRDLWRPHPVEKEKPYHVGRTVELSTIEYENFAEDLLVERSFLQQNIPQGACLLVKARRQREGILVYPQGDRVKWAAYYREEEPDG